MTGPRDKAGTVLFWAILGALSAGLLAIIVLTIAAVVLGLLQVIAWLS